MKKKKIKILAALSFLMVGSVLIYFRYISTRPNLLFKHPSFQFEITDCLSFNFSFSPNGKQIAISGSWFISKETRNSFPDRVYDLKNRKIVMESEWADEAPAYSGCCVWNHDGSFLVMSQRNFELFDTSTWSKPLTIDTPYHFTTGSLSFDSNDNLFFISYAHHEFLNSPSPALVWWNDGDYEIKKMDVVQSCQGHAPYSISASTLDKGIRLAVSHQKEQFVHVLPNVKLPKVKVPCKLEIIRVNQDEKGNHVYEKEYDIPNIYESWVRLTSDGKHLAVLDKKGFHFFQLKKNEAEKLLFIPGPVSIPDYGSYGMDYFFDIPRKTIDISLDDRFIAVAFKDHAEVFRLSDGKSLLQIYKPTYSVAISPDGSLLAVSHLNEQKLQFYKVP